MPYVWITMAVVALALFCAWQNNGLTVSKSEYKDARVPPLFDGFTIVQVSDLHNKRFGARQKRLIRKIESVQPDAVVITGDLIDRRRYDLEAAMEFVRAAASLAPVFYASGNHEAWSGKYGAVREALLEAGVCVLDDASVAVEREGSSLCISGLRDPGFTTTGLNGKADLSDVQEQLKRFSFEERFQILLSHRPELLELYAQNNIPLVFAGHAHGGQFRLPFIGGLYAPHQGVLPKLTANRHRRGQTTLLISRGLGNSVFPLRLFNRPELVVLTLTA